MSKGYKTFTITKNKSGAKDIVDLYKKNNIPAFIKKIPKGTRIGNETLKKDGYRVMVRNRGGLFR